MPSSLVGYPPFSDEREDMALNKQIIGGHYSFPKEYWKDISEEGSQVSLSHLMILCTCTISQHEYHNLHSMNFSAAIDLVKKLLTVDPKKRATLEEVIGHPWFKVSHGSVCNVVIT